MKYFHIVLFLIILSFGIAKSETVNLSPGESIQDAINGLSESGLHTINLESGVYKGNINTGFRIIEFRGSGKDTIIEGDGQGPVIRLGGGGASIVTGIIDNLTVTGGVNQGAVLITSGFVDITRVRFINNTSLTGASVINFLNDRSGQVSRFYNNEFINNHAAEAAIFDTLPLIKSTSADGNSIIFRNSTFIMNDPCIIDYQYDEEKESEPYFGLVENNIFAFNDGPPICARNVIQEDMTSTLAYNLFFQNAGGDMLVNNKRYKDIGKKKNHHALKRKFQSMTLEGNISKNPSFKNLDTLDLELQTNSPAVDKGDPSSIFNDEDGSRGDIGHTGVTIPSYFN